MLKLITVCSWSALPDISRLRQLTWLFRERTIKKLNFISYRFLSFISLELLIRANVAVNYISLGSNPSDTNTLSFVDMLQRSAHLF